MRYLSFGQPSRRIEDDSTHAAADDRRSTFDAAKVLDALGYELEAYFAGELRTFRAPLDLGGTPFQRSVWARVQAIPHGRTCAYGVLAKALTGHSRASRAVAAANGANHLALLVPCHRVVGANGSLTGYAWGLARKRALLALETGQGQLL